MAKGLNRAGIIGRLGQNPEIRYAASGIAVANLSVATNHSVKKDDAWQEETEWHRVTVFGKQAEACGEYLAKGSQVYISGRLQTRSWEDKDGVKRWVTEIVAQDVIFLDSKGQGQRQDRPPAPPDEDEDGMTAGREDGDYEQQDHSGHDTDVPF